MPTRSPTQSEALAVWREGILRDLRVAFPAQVLRYDSEKQLCDVQPLVRDRFQDEDDGWTSITLPPIPNVPVCWMRGGGFVMTMPLAVGDIVEILVNDRSLDQWIEQGGVQDPADQRRHNLSDAVAIPGLHDKQHSIPNVPTDGAMFGAESGPRVKVTTSQIQLGGTDETVACAGKVAVELSALWAVMGSHVHPFIAKAGSDSLNTSPSGETDIPGNVGSSIAKVAS